MNCRFTKHFAAVYKMVEGEKGVIQCRASSYHNEDVYGDIFIPGAFDSDIKRISRSAPIPMLFNHDHNKVIGHWYKMYEEGDHIITEGRLSLGHSIADDIYINLKNGDITGASIGFNAIEAEERRDRNGNYEGMTFKSVYTMENSIVVFQANPEAGVNTVKSAQISPREFERILRDVGNLSQSQAKAFMSDGYSGYVGKFDKSGARDVTTEDELAQRILAVAEKIKT